MEKTIDFAALSLQDALDVAILIEQEAADRYQELADQMEIHHTPDAAKFFKFMVVNELKHGKDLLDRRKSIFGDAPRNIDPLMIWEIEAPEYEKVHVFMSAEEALNVALQSEEKAYRFFVGAIEFVKDTEVRSLFEELREEEILHQKMVKDELAKLPPSARMDASIMADEPVAQ